MICHLLYVCKELYHIKILEDILLCRSHASAIELWSSHYQLRFLCSVDERTRGSPFDITMGVLTIPYGLEYRGGHVRVTGGKGLEIALRRCVGAAYSYKAALLIQCQNRSNQILEADVSCRDIADALGRLCLTTTLLERNDLTIRLLLAKSLYLDAVCAVDMTRLSYSSLQVTSIVSILLKNEF